MTNEGENMKQNDEQINDFEYIDITGIELVPGDNGENCPGNGKHFDEFGNLIECCCEECDYFLLCNDESEHEEKIR